MSAKWRRNKAWDDANLIGPWLPVKWLLRAFSSITLAVILLVFVVLYGTLASVPIGLFALIPTYLFYALTLLVMAVVIAGVPLVAMRGVINRAPSAASRLLIRMIGGGALAVMAAALWARAVWPAIRYVGGPHPSGVRFFSEFVNANSGRLLRQLPALEMTELEFYATWPFRLVLVLFVANMVVATIRRIEFKWLNVGVLTVHTGIVLIALGSIFYKAAKVEGSMVLLKDRAWPKSVFYDNILTAIYVSQADVHGRELMVQTPRLPRYNTAAAGTNYAPNFALSDVPQFHEIFPAGLEISVVGVIPYGVMNQEGWSDGGEQVNPSVEVALISDEPIEGQTEHMTRRLVGRSPADGTFHIANIIAIQHLVMPSRQRVADLTTTFDDPSDHFLIVRVPRAGHEERLAVQIGEKFELGETGWTIEVAEHQAPDEGLAIITEGYRGAKSSRLRLEVTRPDGTSFSRSVLSRYPELTQDFTMEPGNPQPRRTPPDPDLDITYIDATSTNFHVVQPNPIEARFEVIRRAPQGELMRSTIEAGERVNAGESLGVPLYLRVDKPMTHTTPNVVVRPVPESEQQRDLRGTFSQAFLDVEVKARQADGEPWIRRIWLPFNQYLDLETAPVTRELKPPGIEGGLRLAFGRLRRTLPGVALALESFEMIPYPGTETPRDFVSNLRVFTEHSDAQGAIHATRLNRPYIYRVPFEWRDDRSFVANAASRVFRAIVPDQYKFSQAGWDPEGQRYTVLGVGNNSGIYIVAVGAILVAIGIPLAFYVKPAILRYQKRKLQRDLEANPAMRAGRNGVAIRRDNPSREPEEALLGGKR